MGAGKVYPRSQISTSFLIFSYIGTIKYVSGLFVTNDGMELIKTKSMVSMHEAGVYRGI